MTQTSDLDQGRLSSCLRLVRKILFTQSETPGMDAQVLLADILQRPKAWVIAHPEARLDDNQQVILQRVINRLETGIPLPYVLGHWEFYGLDFTLTPDVLIPRPETELLVEEAIHFLETITMHPSSGNQLDHRQLKAVDVGTGSGIIAICLAKAIPGLTVLGVDQSRSALNIARRNAQQHGVANQTPFFQGDLLYAVEGKFDLIAANLPYIPSSKLSELPVSKHEPVLALDGGPDGLAQIRRLLSDCFRLVAPGGRIYLEIEANEGAATERLARQLFSQASFTIKNDYQGHQRLFIISL